MIKDNTLNIVIFGLSITSSWGNGHATTYRGLIRELTRRGHKVIFFEKNLDFYESNRDLPTADYCKIILYDKLTDLNKYKEVIAAADLVIVGSYVPNGVKVGYFVVEHAKGIKAFYDIDTPVTLTKLKNEDYEYLEPMLISQYDMYLSFTGGPTLNFIEEHYRSPKALPFYCSFDPDLYFKMDIPKKWLMGYLGTYSRDKQPALRKLLLEPAAQMPLDYFVVAGPQYPIDIIWPQNIERIQHLPPSEHADFYNSQIFTLNITRADMVKAGFSPSVRLFEAAACAVPIISDYWNGIETILKPDEEILIAHTSEDVIKYLNNLSDDERIKIGENAQMNVMENHTAEKRAIQLEEYYEMIVDRTKKPISIKNNY